MGIRTLLPMAADGIGPSFTCARLVEGARRSGADIDLLVNRYRMGERSPGVQALLGGPLSRLPYRVIHTPASRALERWYLSRIRPGDVAWLWPSVSLDLHERLARRGVPIVLEGINTRMARAREVLDAAYENFGAAPAHGITEARIVEEEAKFALADTIFAPSPGVEAALRGSPLEHRYLASSYGVDTAQPLPPRAARPGGVTYVFCGYFCVRKGAHHLLDVWPRMPSDARLRIVGRIEPVIATRYADLLSSDRIEAVGFTRDVAPHYAASDVMVFPSLEEGDPLVTYEAALHGLAIVASAPGAGRIGAEQDCITVIDPQDREAFLEALLGLHRSAEARADWGARARAAVSRYDWTRVGGARAAQLAERFAAGPALA
ncbi:glycosyltransferase family 4 protein [Roseitranquillus sediminis]|uniref:glycosyltransferase family 4 protein n=1 Tax=Roseitranquillus sediminis TaxID=2809051 RepID=UPI001D0BFAB7|nr:glycosyltransferase family 4 protein [Roseitranquillus sediminis]